MLTIASAERASARTLAAIAAAFTAILVLLWLGSADFVGDDEALDAGVVQTIHRENEWLYPEFNGSYLPPKPPLFYWLGAIVAELNGAADEWAVRLPSALAAIVTMLVTVAAGSRAVGTGGAFLGGLMLALMPVFRDQARLGRADMTMTALTTAILFLYARREPLAGVRRWLFFTLLGLAAIAKGAAGIGLVFVVVAVDTWLEGDRRRARALLHPAAIAFPVIGGFWYALGVGHWGDRFFLLHVVGENARHFFGSLVVDERPVRGLLHHATHFVNIFTGTLPWGFLLPFAWRGSVGEPGSADEAEQRFLRRWLLAGFVFFTLATRKSPYYLLPIFPPLALLVGGWLWPRIVAAENDRADPGRCRGWAARGAFLAIAAVAIWLLCGMPGLDADRAAVLQRSAGASLFCWTAILVIGAAFGVAVGALFDGYVRELVAAALLTGAAASVLTSFVEAPLADAQSLRPLAEAVVSSVPPAQPLYFFEMPLPAVALYAERSIPVASPRDAPPARRFFLIVPESLDERVPVEWKSTARVVFEDRARVFTRRPMTIRLLEIAIGGAPRVSRGGPAHAGPPAAATPNRSGGVAVIQGLTSVGWSPAPVMGEAVKEIQAGRSEPDCQGQQAPCQDGVDELFSCQHFCVPPLQASRP